MKLLYYFSFYLLGFKRKVEHVLSDLAAKKDIVCSSGVRFTRTAKAENLSKSKLNITIGKNSLIEGKLLVFSYGGKITIGNNSYIGYGSNVRSGQSISIGNNVLISHNVNIIDTNSHEIDYLERAENYKKALVYGMPKEKGNVLTGEIIIEDYVWVSYGVSILKNIKIGKGAIIASNSVVTKDVPAFSMVAGNPAKVMKMLK